MDLARVAILFRVRIPIMNGQEMIRKGRGFAVAVLCVLTIISPAALLAHPHIYVDTALELVADERGMVSLIQEWTLAENYSSRLISLFDLDQDGAFSSDEACALREQAFDSLASYNYFTHIIVDDDDMASRLAEDFSAAIVYKRVRYRFTLPLRVSASNMTVRVGVYDDTNYVSFALRNFIDPRNAGSVRYESRIWIDFSRYCAAQHPGQRMIDIAMSVIGDAAMPAFSASPLSLVDPDFSRREMDIIDPFLRDQNLYQGFSADNPFLSF